MRCVAGVDTVGRLYISVYRDLRETESEERWRVRRVI